MKVGITTVVTAGSIGPAELGRAAEDRGFYSLGVPEHSHIPVSRQTPFVEGSELPQAYYRTLDPFILLTAAAAATSGIRLGTAIALVTQRDPILLAKESATLDVLSGGRFRLGVGAGWNREEMSNHGTDPRTRMALMRERVLAIKRIWTNDTPEFHGKYVDFDPIYQWPKPLQLPHPPVLVGGDGPTVFERVLEYGDAWMPTAGDRPRALVSRIERLKKRCTDLGRPPVDVVASAVTAEPRAIREAAELDVTEFTVRLPTMGRDAALRELDRVSGIAHSLGLVQ